MLVAFLLSGPVVEPLARENRSRRNLQWQRRRRQKRRNTNRQRVDTSHRNFTGLSGEAPLERLFPWLPERVRPSGFGDAGSPFRTLGQTFDPRTPSRFPNARENHLFQFSKLCHNRQTTPHLAGAYGKWLREKKTATKTTTLRC
jgi:hypothetical protein